MEEAGRKSVKIKMVDVARHLGLSKATVSLVVNGKPGVNEETRKRVLACIEEMRENGGRIRPAEEPVGHTAVKKAADQLIKVLIVNHHKQVVCDPELDLWSEVLSTFDAEARKRGYFYGLTYLNDTQEERNAVIEECNANLVAGIILFGTEMIPEDYRILEQIKKPIVVYDYEMPDGVYSSVCIDNAGAVKTGLDLLYQAGAKHITYLCTGKNIYNFRKRREAFCNTLIGTDAMPMKSDMVELGETIPKITEHMCEWLDLHPLPEGFLFENYQVSIGVMTALRRAGVRIPDAVKVVGIDEIPETILSDVKLTQIKIPHAERASMAMELLDKEITGQWHAKIKVFAEPEVIVRDSL